MSEQKHTLRCGKCNAVIPNAPGDTLDYARIAAILGGKVYCAKRESPRTKMLKRMATR